MTVPPSRATCCSPAPPASSAWSCWRATWSAASADVVTLVRADSHAARAGPRRRGAGEPVRRPRRPDYRPRVHAVRRRHDRAGPRAHRGRARPAGRAGDRRSSTAPRRCRSRCRSTRRGRSTSRAPGGCSSSPSSPASAAAWTATPTSPPRSSPATTTGRFAECDLDVGQAFHNSYEQSKFEAEQLVRSHDGPAVHDPAAEHRRRRPQQRLDLRLQRPLLAAARIRPRAVHRRAGDPVGAGRRRLDRLRRRRRLRSCASPSCGIGATYHLTAGADASHDRRARRSGQPLLPPPGAAGDPARRVRGPMTLGAAERKALEAGSEYFPYFCMEAVFDDRETRSAAGARRDHEPRRCATTWTGCWTSPRAAAGASARSPGSTRSPPTRPASAQSRVVRSSDPSPGERPPSRGVVAAARVAAHDGRAAILHRSPRSPTSRVFAPMTPTRSCTRRWPARLPARRGRANGRTAWRATIHPSNAGVLPVRRCGASTWRPTRRSGSG